MVLLFFLNKNLSNMKISELLGLEWGWTESTDLNK